MKIERSKEGSLIVPVEIDWSRLPSRLTIGPWDFVRKIETHVTVLGYSLGKAIRKEENESIRLQIDSKIDELDWSVTSIGFDEPCHLSRRGLNTIIVPATCDAHFFFRRFLGEFHFSDSLHRRCVMSQVAHVTLYTSDPSGKKGIGINSWEEFEQARGKRTDELSVIQLRWDILTAPRRTPIDARSIW